VSALPVCTGRTGAGGIWVVPRVLPCSTSRLNADGLAPSSATWLAPESWGAGWAAYDRASEAAQIERRFDGDIVVEQQMAYAAASHQLGISDLPSFHSYFFTSRTSACHGDWTNACVSPGRNHSDLTSTSPPCLTHSHMFPVLLAGIFVVG
jgi:hypothetical protein